MARRIAFGVGSLVVACFYVACGDSPTKPNETLGTAAPASTGSKLSAQNQPPRLVFKSLPPADFATTPPTISGKAPLRVTLNLCNADDPDPGDSLNWQFNYGDSGRPAFNPDGTFNPDFDQFCRADHEYLEGSWTATVSVTDKHLEDQASRVGDAGTAARRSQQIRVVALGNPPPEPSPTFCHSIVSADGSGNAAACPSGATQFCDAQPVVASSAAQAQMACNACYGGGCFLNTAPAAGGLGYESPATHILFLYIGTSGGCGPAVPAGAVFDKIPCKSVGGWAF